MKMKESREYRKPNLELIELSAPDILTTSDTKDENGTEWDPQGSRAGGKEEDI